MRTTVSKKVKEKLQCKYLESSKQHQYNNQLYQHWQLPTEHVSSYPSSDMLTNIWPANKVYTYCHLSHVAFATSTRPNSELQRELQKSNPRYFVLYEQLSRKAHHNFFIKEICLNKNYDKRTLAEDPALLNEPLKPFLESKPCPKEGIQGILYQGNEPQV